MATSNVSALTTPSIVGMMINCGLMGSLIVQVFHYYCAFPNDRVIAKTVVYTVFILEILHTTLMGCSSDGVFGSAYGHFPDAPAWTTWVSATVLTALIAAIVQIFYAARLYSFSGSKIVTGTVILLALLQCASATAKATTFKMTGNHPSNGPDPYIVWLAGSAMCDVIIAGAMTFYVRISKMMNIGTSTHLPILFQLQRAAPVSNRVKNRLSTLIRATIGTGAVTAVGAVLQIILTFAFPETQYFAAGAWFLGKLYSNSLLVLLNARAIVVGGRDDETNTQKAREIEVAQTLCGNVSGGTLSTRQGRLVG
ncbi:hypothetical protein FB45DRAFT_1034822 [Roridomyces roridus]|uniref:DUF6534 domain-containing protein n=1 Tax=Roridomyces roridus TaxID=1738132 RepID=A0AAD7BBI9_9AGAR|nr:hypothetical protein FB45DRAFT_1034822 [Roridomyces roridus]